MVKVGLQRNAATLRGQLVALSELFNEHDNHQSVKRVKDLAVKLEKQEFAIAFCGHFSAGKSSMINTLMGENILPSSPIPTSANLVKIKSGDDYAKVFFKEDTPHIYPAPYDFEKVKSYCKDGDQIQSIEISYSKTSIPKDVLIMDTPGIDSTDDAHRIATESALHLADLIFYVMDYNHVQSELNFLFTKELTEAGKEVYLVINQIDKHREEELRFIDFQNSVVESFASWGVKPAKIFYTSLKQQDHPYNQFSSLKEFIGEKINDRIESLPQSIYVSLNRLCEEHSKFLIQQDDTKSKDLEQLLAELTEEDREKLLEHVDYLKNELQILQEGQEKVEKELYDKVNDLLDNAYLMPFETRDLAQAYLATRQPDFKVGLLFSKQKTEQERLNRLEQFFTDLAEKVTSQIDWHIKELFQTLHKKHEIHDEALISAIQHFSVKFNQDLLASEVKPGARVTGDYVLKYCNDVTEAIKRQTKEQLSSIQNAYFDLFNRKQENEIQKLKTQLSHYMKYFQAFSDMGSIKEKQRAIKDKMTRVLSGQFDAELYQEKAKDLGIEELEEAKVIQHDFFVEEETTKPIKERLTYEVSSKGKTNGEELKQLISNLRYSANQVEKVPGFQKLSVELIQKAERLENQSFTVALFGAFSAGKSSFANALIGDRLLPVSPNPTTAAINKIMPVDETHHHGLVLVKLKALDTLMADVNRSLAAFERRAETLDEAIKTSRQIISTNINVDPFEKMHIAFLQAFVRGLSAYQSQLGETIKTDLNEFSSFVANEEKSCLVELIEVYYDCDLTRKGITLVDTPGADSINARHTGVAFDYIKNSDAILFVTYYNHAFSKADREFLIQLGRVKDTFSLDKMFFIVNAIDLANSEDEMHAVLDYVEEQLLVFGIRKPHLYPVSSMSALNEKLAGVPPVPSRMKIFEDSFYAFIDHDLREIAMNSAKSDLQKMFSQLQNFIGSAQADEETKEKKKTQFISEKAKVLEFMDKQNDGYLQQRLGQETEELVYYIKQRVFLRFNDFLKESFNPALLKDDGRNLKKALQTALDSFLEDFGYDFAQELRATALRLEAFIGRLIVETERSIDSQLREWNPELTFSSFELDKLESTDFDIAFTTMDHEVFKKALSYFRNPKSFFEKNERKYLSDELEKTLQEPADDYLAKGKGQLIEHYGRQLTNVFQEVTGHITVELEEYYQGALASISNDFPIDELKRIQQNLLSVVDKAN
ncbi:dynamin family protein [Niallia sp. XMNu-256]|uniref:dynamin family protein n=1 Tax=Niallia sp. XMNu-256 TaxID=3082444 RepID=UPI0030CE7BD3